MREVDCHSTEWSSTRASINSSPVRPLAWADALARNLPGPADQSVPQAVASFLTTDFGSHPSEIRYRYLDYGGTAGPAVRNASNTVFALRRSAVSNPSVNQP